MRRSEVIVFLLCVVLVVTLVMARLLPAAQAQTNCRQYLDRALYFAERRYTGGGDLDMASVWATEALAYAKIAEVCTKF